MSQKTAPIIGLAGGIGAGKSAVARILADAGCVVADSDSIARQSLFDPEIRRQIVERWGSGVLNEQGEVDRSILASIVFNNPSDRTALESIVHPWVEERRVEQFRNARDDAAAHVIDAPLLFEAGLDRLCDAVIFVDAPRHVRLNRVRRSRGWDEAELAKREDSQLALDDKRRRADYVVQNHGSLEDLDERVRDILATIVRSHHGRTT